MKTLIIHADDSGQSTIKSADISYKQAYRVLLTALADIADKLTLDEIKEALSA